MSSFNPFAALASADLEMAAEDANSVVVKALVKALPDATLNVGADKGGSGTIETVLGYNRLSDSVRIVGDDELEAMVHLKHGIMTKNNMSAGALLMVVQALNKVPDNQCPLIILAIAYAMLQLSLKGFTQLTLMQQAAVAVLFIPSSAGYTALCNVAEALEQIDLKETLENLDHVCACHDEGSDNLKRNCLLFYLIMLVHGLKQRRCVGLLQPGKRGPENAAAMIERGMTVGLCDNIECPLNGEVNPPHSCPKGCTYEHGVKVLVRTTLMTVDKAGSKVALGLRVLGLIFIIVCECHCLSIVAGPSGFCAGFGMPKHGDYRHGWQFMHAMYRMIRKHCGIKMFFQHLHRRLDQLLIKVGAPEGVRTNAADLQSRADLGDVPVIGRWEYMQKAAWHLRRTNPELIDPHATLLRLWLGRAGITDCRLCPMLKEGFVAIGIYEHHRWYSQPNSKESEFGELPHVVVLARGLADSWITAQLDLTCDIYDRVLRPSFMLARRDGARFLLKNRSLRVELLQRMKECETERLSCWSEVAALPELSRSLFRLAIARVFESSLKKSVEQREWAGMDNLLVALADEDLAWEIGWLIHSYLVEEGLTPALGGAHAPPVRPKYTVVMGAGEGHSRQEITMQTTPHEIAERERTLIDGRIGRVAACKWWPLFADEPPPSNIMPGFLQWLFADCIFTAEHPQNEPFYKLFHQCFIPAEGDSLVVESGMNDMKETARGTKGGKTATAMQQNLLIDDLKRRNLREADQRFSLRRGGGKRTKTGGSSQTHEPRTRAKTFFMFLTIETENFALGRRLLALDLVHTFKGREELQQSIVRRKVEDERSRHAIKATAYHDVLMGLINAPAAELHEVQPAAFGLRKLTAPGYKMDDMVATLIALELRDGAFDVSLRKKELFLLKALRLRELLVEKFFGDEFHFVASVTYAPDNLAKEAQELAVAQAVGRGWVQRKPPP